MANIIRIKRRAAGGAAGAPASLKNAELAYNEQDQTLYYGYGDSGGNASSVIPIAGKGAYVDITTNQTIGGTKTFSQPIVGSVTGNSETATKLATARAISMTGDVAWTVSFDGSGNVSAAGLLATVNSNVGTHTKVTVNEKGLVTAAGQASFSDFAAPTGDISLNGFKFTNAANPVSAQDFATKAYVDSIAQGLNAKNAVRVATTDPITLSGTQTIDGVTVVDGDRVLVKNQLAATQNGIYIAATGAWSRATDADTWDELVSAFVFVKEGTTLSNSGWVSTVRSGGTLGSTDVTWTQFSAAGAYVAGAGLVLNGNTFDVGGTADRISVGSDSIDIAATYVGQASITTLGTVTTGAWNASVVGAQYGGTGLASLTTNGIVFGNGTNPVGVTPAGLWDGSNNVGQLLSVNSLGVPTWTNTIDGGFF